MTEPVQYEYKHSFVNPDHGGGQAGANDSIAQQLQQETKNGWRIVDIDRKVGASKLWSVVWERVSVSE